MSRALLVTLAGLLAALTLYLPPASAGVPAKLAREARYVAAHGGVLGSCHGCSTPRMQRLVRRLIVARFAPSGASAVSTALCVARGESGFNPGAISRTGDYGVFQINRPSWERSYDWVRILDPVYNVGVGWAMSRRGYSWSPWVVYTNGGCS